MQRGQPSDPRARVGLLDSSDPMNSTRPAPLHSLDPAESVPGDTVGEVGDLRTLRDCGFAVAPMVIVPADAEAEFYRLNNLGARLGGMFDEIDLRDPDDEDIEDLAPLAESLVSSHYLLDEFIDSFYESTSDIPGRLHVRRPGSVGLECAPGRPSLLALKRTWSSDWTFEALWSRLSATGQLLPEARPVLVHPAPLKPLGAQAVEDAAALLGRPVELLGGDELGIAMVDEAEPL